MEKHGTKTPKREGALEGEVERRRGETEPVKDRLAASAAWTEMSPPNGSAGLDAGARYLIPALLGSCSPDDLRRAQNRSLVKCAPPPRLSSREARALFVAPSARGSVILSWKLTI